MILDTDSDSVALKRPAIPRIRFSLFALLVIVTLAACYFRYANPPKARATAVMTLPQRNFGSVVEQDVFLETQLHLVNSPFVLQAALDQVSPSEIPDSLLEATNKVDWLSARLNTRYDDKGDLLIEMTATDATREELQSIADAIAKAFFKQVLEQTDFLRDLGPQLVPKREPE